MKPKLICLVLLWALIIPPIVSQADADEYPYLYYYSQVLGGIIVERADGTDSRHIGADVIPAGMSGMANVGWSPSGRYFATYETSYNGYKVSSRQPYIIDMYDDLNIMWLDFVGYSTYMEWSPMGEDILLIMSGEHQSHYWLANMATGELLVDFGLPNLVRTRDRQWDIENEAFTFYMQLDPDFYADHHIYHVTMKFDGTVIRERVDPDDAPSFVFYPSSSDDQYYGVSTSPSGDYTTEGTNPTTLTHVPSDTHITLPIHSQQTICREFIWHETEQYIITMNGTLRAGGGCGLAVMGVTDNKGELWRELGYCTWGCIDWLPEQVDIESLPTASTTPIQLDPVRIEYDEQGVSGISSDDTDLRLVCLDDNSASIIDSQMDTLRYRLARIACPYNKNDPYLEDGIPIIVAYDPTYDLLVTYYDDYPHYHTTIWTSLEGHYQPNLLLTTDGYQLEFTDDGDYLRARNVYGWKVYAVDDILARLKSE